MSLPEIQMWPGCGGEPLPFREGLDLPGMRSMTAVSAPRVATSRWPITSLTSARFRVSASWHFFRPVNVEIRTYEGRKQVTIGTFAIRMCSPVDFCNPHPNISFFSEQPDSNSVLGGRYRVHKHCCRRARCGARRGRSRGGITTGKDQVLAVRDTLGRLGENSPPTVVDEGTSLALKPRRSTVFLGLRPRSGIELTEIGIQFFDNAGCLKRWLPYSVGHHVVIQKLAL